MFCDLFPLSREKLRTLRSLSSSKLRKKKGLCLVEGERALREAQKAGFLEYLILAEGGGEIDLDQAGRYFPRIPFYGLDQKTFRELTDVRTGPGVFGVARIPPPGDFGVLLQGKDPSILLFLDGLQEPGNVGGIIRTGWALGIRGVMLGPGTADPFSSKGVRASAGGVFNLPLFHGILRRDLESLRKGGYSLFLAESKGTDFLSVRFSPKSILVLGNEGHGPSEEARGLGLSIGIPMARGVDSLNVLAAGSMILGSMVRGERRRKA